MRGILPTRLPNEVLYQGELAPEVASAIGGLPLLHSFHCLAIFQCPSQPDVQRIELINENAYGLRINAEPICHVPDGPLLFKPMAKKFVQRG